MAPCCLLGALLLALIGLVTSRVRSLFGAPAASEPIWDRPRRRVGHARPFEPGAHEAGTERESIGTVALAGPRRNGRRWLPSAAPLAVGSLVVLVAVGVHARWHAGEHASGYAESKLAAEPAGAWCRIAPSRSAKGIRAGLEVPLRLAE
jgi:hypothetical protein